MDQKILDFEKEFRKPKLPEIRPGDTVRVHQRVEEGGKTRIHQFEGTVIATKHGKGLSGSFTVRKTGAGGVGVEQSFFWHAPTLFKVERIRAGEARRAKLYYLRRLTSRQVRKLTGARVGEIWEETEQKEAAKQQQRAEAAASDAVKDKGKAPSDVANSEKKDREERRGEEKEQQEKETGKSESAKMQTENVVKEEPEVSA